jgi:hypothetical protein
MDLKKGAVTKRWSRLTKVMENGEAPSPSVYKFLWLCVKHSSRDKVIASCLPSRRLHAPAQLTNYWVGYGLERDCGAV